MEASSRAGVVPRLPDWRLPIPGPAVGGVALSFATVVYLALADGGYDTIPRGQVGIVAWWIVLLAAGAGVLPRRLGRAGWLALALIVGFAGWTGASILWSISAERSADELGMVAAYAGVFVLAVTVQGRTAARHAVYGAGAAVGVVAVLAVVSRLHSSWFPPDPRLALAASASKLAYPLGYWNGLAAFLAIGIAPLLAIAGGARRIVVQAVASAALPVAVLGIYLTDSRGGAVAVLAGVGAFVLLSPDRLAAVATTVAGAAGSGILVAYADRHPTVRSGVETLAGVRAGDRMIVVLVLVCAGVGLLAGGIGLAARHANRPSWLRPRPRVARMQAAAVVAAVALAAVGLGGPGRVERAWQTFKAPPPAVTQTANQPDVFSRLSSAAGNSRYQFWVQAVKANRTRPLTGIGGGTFGLWWNVHATTAAFHITDAHSLYLQTLAETGIVGLILLGGLIACLLVGGAWRALRAPPELRLPVAGATAGVAAFATSAAYDWVWQLGAIATLALILGAVCVAGRESAPERRSPALKRQSPAPERQSPTSDRPGPVARVAVCAGAVAAIAAVILPLAGARDIAQSRAAAARGDLRGALADARSAHGVQPYAASPLLQEALVLEAAGDLPAARDAAVGAVSREATNWQPRLVLARIESELGLKGQAVAAFSRARSLDPLGKAFNP